MLVSFLQDPAPLPLGIMLRSFHEKGAVVPEDHEGALCSNGLVTAALGGPSNKA